MLYELRKCNVEISYKNRAQIKPGCTQTQDGDIDPEVIASFTDKDEALEALKGYESSIKELSGGAGKYYSFEEYYVEEADYNEDGEWVDGGDIWGFSKIPSEQRTFFYLATNIWGCGRALEPDNGWTVSAFESKKKRDNSYDDLNFEQTGVFIPSDSEIRKILGIDDETEYYVSCIGDDSNGYEVEICE